MAKKYSVHAEQACINNVKNKNILKECTLVLLKLNRNGYLTDCEPCEMCAHIIKKYKIKKVIVIK